MSPAILSLQDVFCLYRTGEADAAALQGLSLELAAGERVCVIGPSGAGKTTLLRVAAGLQAPSTGAVLLFGRDLGRIGARQRGGLRHRFLGFLDQHAERALSPDLTVGQAIGLPLALRGAPRRALRYRVSELVLAAGLSDRRGARPHELSGGERQRVALCAAIAPRPRLLLADEPTAELDPLAAAAIATLIAELAAAEGSSVLMVSHDPGLAAAAARAVRIRDGRIVSERTSAGTALAVDRGGWVRLPRAIRDGAGIGSAVTAALGENEIRLSPAGPGGSRAPAATPSPVPAQRAEPVSVELHTVSRRRGGRRPVLDDLSFAFAAGRLTAVTGASGAGKTTLLELLAGLAQADSGAVRLDGADLGTLDAEARAELRRRRIGYLSQEPSPIDFLTATENVVLALRIRGRAADSAIAQARSLLAALGLGSRATQRVGRLSAGEAQRVALASALACAEGLLIVDEPTSRLDPTSAGRVLRLLGEASAAGHTVICATHDVDLIAAADEVLALRAPGQSPSGSVTGENAHAQPIPTRGGTP